VGRIGEISLVYKIFAHTNKLALLSLLELMDNQLASSSSYLHHCNLQRKWLISGDDKGRKAWRRDSTKKFRHNDGPRVGFQPFPTFFNIADPAPQHVVPDRACRHSTCSCHDVTVANLSSAQYSPAHSETSKEM